ncbi:hypothetical protein V8F20_002675 [Naviculisporaceae sp. PSN 640]
MIPYIIVYFLVGTFLGGNLAAALSFTNMFRYLGMRDYTDTDNTNFNNFTCGESSIYCPWCCSIPIPPAEWDNRTTLCHFFAQWPDDVAAASNSERKDPTYSVMSWNLKEMYGWARQYLNGEDHSYFSFNVFVPSVRENWIRNATVEILGTVPYNSSKDLAGNCPNRGCTYRGMKPSFGLHYNRSNGQDFWADTVLFNSDAWNYPKPFNAPEGSGVSIYHALFQCLPDGS